MISALIVVRDVIIALALSWIGVTVERAASKPEPCPLNGADAGICGKAGFDAGGCRLD